MSDKDHLWFFLSGILLVWLMLGLSLLCVFAAIRLHWGIWFIVPAAVGAVGLFIHRACEDYGEWRKAR